ncbi:sensor histidine kinase [Parvibium lacunae]|uniref:histidine kinase n=1 Tax=Parvibium lacunae TaxID=1888893 RepID=A0A368L1N9_9BURK|nr:ATP-binding protein [Parvibium lacunae]RCS57475.1 hypothetical protein DU000_08465 [Parvibium lacunae]
MNNRAALWGQFLLGIRRPLGWLFYHSMPRRWVTWPALLWLGLLVLSLGCLLWVQHYSERAEFNRLDDLATRQLDLYIAALDSELERHAYLASLLEGRLNSLGQSDLLGNPPFGASPRPMPEAIHIALADMAVRAGVREILLVNLHGEIVSSSEWFATPDKVGRSFQQHPQRSRWLQESQQGIGSHWFLPNPDNQAPEYYFSYPFSLSADKQASLALPNPEKQTLIAVVKISLASMESYWVDLAFRPDSEKILVVDGMGQIILSSIPQWKNQNLAILQSQEKLTTASRTPEASGPPGQVTPNRSLIFVVEQSVLQGAYLIRRNWQEERAAEEYIVHQRAHPQTGWRVMLLSNPEATWHNIQVTVLSTCAGLAFLHLLYFYLLLRRQAMQRMVNARNALQHAHDQLELKIAERTQTLHHVNRQLLEEIQERQSVQAALMQANKMAALGTMSAKLAHEISQPLTALKALSNNGQQLLQQGRYPEVNEGLQAIRDIVNHMHEITQQLKLFSAKRRPGATTLQPVNLTTVIERVARVLHDKFEQQAVQLHVAPTLPSVRANSVQLEQVLTNLLSNAIDAMQILPSEALRIIDINWQDVVGNPDRVLIEVSDSGPGISEEAMQHLFEPFYTNKPNGKGLGLGLPIAASIITEHGGTLTACRAVPTPEQPARCGACFMFDLERADPPLPSPDSV